jgi:hypothetical protein
MLLENEEEDASMEQAMLSQMPDTVPFRCVLYSSFVEAILLRWFALLCVRSSLLLPSLVSAAAFCARLCCCLLRSSLLLPSALVSAAAFCACFCCCLLRLFLLRFFALLCRVSLRCSLLSSLLSSFSRLCCCLLRRSSAREERLKMTGVL